MRAGFAWALAAALTGSLALSSLAPADTLRIVSGEFPPYATEARPDHGIALSIVRRAFELGGHQVEFHFRPWSRAQMETQRGLWDASAHWGASAERRALFLLSDNLLSEEWVFLHRRETAFDWQRLDDLKPYLVGMTRDYTYTPEIWAAARSGQLRHANVNNDLAGLKLLLAGRIDVLPLERNVACDLLVQNFPDSTANQLRAHPRPMTDHFTTHVLFAKSMPLSPKYLKDFNLGLAKLRASAEYGRLRANVSCPSAWR